MEGPSQVEVAFPRVSSFYLEGGVLSARLPALVYVFCTSPRRAEHSRLSGWSSTPHIYIYIFLSPPTTALFLFPVPHPPQGWERGRRRAGSACSTAAAVSKPPPHVGPPADPELAATGRRASAASCLGISVMVITHLYFSCLHGGDIGRCRRWRDPHK